MKKFQADMMQERGRSAMRSPSVRITPQAKIKLDLYVAEVPGEVSGLGTVEHLGKSAFLITDVFLFKQECNEVETELSSADVSRFLVEAVQEGFDPSLIKLWWHSHADMPVFWSATDEFTAGKFANGFMLSLVANKQREYLCRLDLYDPFRLTADELSFDIWFAVHDDLREAIKLEVAKKVHPKKVKIPAIIKRDITAWMHMQEGGDSYEQET